MKKPEKDQMIYTLFDEFWGPHSIFSILAFVIGGILIGRTVWGIVHQSFGPIVTIVLGIILLSLGGIALHEFDD